MKKQKKMNWQKFKQKFKEGWIKFRKFDSALDLGKQYGYKFNKWIFRSAILLMILLWVGVAWSLDWDFQAHVYISCSNLSTASTCANPLAINAECSGQPGCFNPTQHEQFEHRFDDLTTGFNKIKYPGLEEELDNVRSWNPIMQRGEERGTKPPALVQHFSLICMVILAIAFIINHFIYNRKFKFPHEVEEN